MLNIANKRKNCKSIRFVIESGFPISFLEKLSNAMSSRLDREIERFDLEKEDSVWPVHTIRRVLKSIRDGNLISKDK